MTSETLTPQQVKDEALGAVRRYRRQIDQASARARRAQRDREKARAQTRALRRAMRAAAAAAKDLGARDEELADALRVGPGMAQRVVAQQRASQQQENAA